MLETGNELIQKGSDAGPLLRELQGEVNKLKVAERNMRFMCFFISSFVEDLYFNLSGDFPYDVELNGIIDELFRKVGHLLIKLANAEPMVAYDVYLDMVHVYLNGLSQIEEFSGE